MGKNQGLFLCIPDSSFISAMSLGKLCHGGQGKWGRYNTFPDYLPIGLQLPYAEEGLGEVVCVVAERSGCVGGCTSQLLAAGDNRNMSEPNCRALPDRQQIPAEAEHIQKAFF